MSFEIKITDIPNDTFLFGPWIQGKTKGPKVRVHYQDIEKINKEILQGKGADLCKISFNILPYIMDKYLVLPIGSTIFSSSSPHIISTKKIELKDIPKTTLAVPGKNTTAYLLSKILLPKFKETKEFIYSDIYEALKKNVCDCGLIIHNTNSSLKNQGFYEVFKLGDLWQKKTNGLPLALGGIVARRTLGKEKLASITNCLEKSLDYAYKNKNEIFNFVLEKSKQKDIEIIKKNIETWVNSETICMSTRGKKAIETLVSLSCNKLNLKKEMIDIFN